MQAIAPKKNVERKSAEVRLTPARELAARISLRAVSAIEITSVLVSVIITSWAIIPLQPRQQWLMALPALLAMALMINSQRARGESMREVGFGTKHFSRALRLLAKPTIIACAGFAAIGYGAGSYHRTTHFWTNALATPLWALIQQYVLQAFIYRRVRFLLLDDALGPDERKTRVRLAIFVTAVIFSFTHAPNPTLMTLTFAGALIW